MLLPTSVNVVKLTRDRFLREEELVPWNSSFIKQNFIHRLSICDMY